MDNPIETSESLSSDLEFIKKVIASHTNHIFKLILDIQEETRDFNERMEYMIKDFNEKLIKDAQ